jgi:hypothetical protein
MIPQRKNPRHRRRGSANRPSDGVASNRVRQSKAVSEKLAEKTRATKGEPIKLVHDLFLSSVTNQEFFPRVLGYGRACREFEHKNRRSAAHGTC